MLGLRAWVRVGRYDVTVHEIEGMPDGVDEALLAWVRGPKAQFTKGAAVDNGKVAINQMLHQVATIYRCVASLSSLSSSRLVHFRVSPRRTGVAVRTLGRCVGLLSLLMAGWMPECPVRYAALYIPSQPIRFWPRMQKSNPPHCVRFMSARLGLTGRCTCVPPSTLYGSHPKPYKVLRGVVEST